jgi:hypothetical protein
MITEGIFILPGEVITFSGTLKKWLFIDVFPIVKDRGWIFYSLLIIFLFWAIYSVVNLATFSRWEGVNLRI